MRSAVGRSIAAGLAALLVSALLFAHLGSVVGEVSREETGAARRSWSRRCWSCQSFVVKILPRPAIKIVLTVWQIISQVKCVLRSHISLGQLL